MVTVTAAPSDEPQWETTEPFASAVLNSTNVLPPGAQRRRRGVEPDPRRLRKRPRRRRLPIRPLGGFPYGENLARGYPDVASSVAVWGEEAERYDDGGAGFAPETGHFTRLVWKKTTAAGCARRLCGRSGWYLVCE
ncbi:hypothetical protein E4U42_005566 [Claviceps africana]|uniref:SCP domain-containing protein n=1 Tax=Claviceps africana TaxID=83212 RepID=A0A8K0JD12_9HYPO|nr:hypothetical protein E4U42_005566 [Claviceps africana]